MSKATTKKAPAPEKATAPDSTPALKKALVHALTDEQKALVADSRFASLKNQELAYAGVLLDGIGTGATALAVDQWGIYARITRDKLYVEDGMKNVGEFAEKYFNESKSSASHKSTVFNRFFAPDASDDAKRVRSFVGIKLEPLYELSALSDEQLASLDQNQLTSMTLKKARAVKNSIIPPKEKVIKTGTISGSFVSFPFDSTDAEGNTKHYEGVISSVKAEHVPLDSDSMLDAVGMTRDDKLITVKFDGGVVYNVAVNPVGNVAVFVTTEDKPEKKEKASEIPVAVVNIVLNMDKYGHEIGNIMAVTSLTEEQVKSIIARGQ